MKKIIVFMILLCGFIATMYFVMLWEPSDYNGESTVKVEDEEALQVMATEKSVLKGPYEELKSISVEEKNEMKELISSLSTYDISKVKEAFSNEDYNIGIREGLEILQKRLSSEKFERIKEILEPFVDFNLIGDKV